MDSSLWAAYTLGYLLFLILLWIAKEKQGLRLFDHLGFASNLPMLFGLHIGGIILFGFLPYVARHPGTFLLFNWSGFNSLATWVVVLLVTLSLIITPRLADKKFRECGLNKPLFSPAGLSFYLLYFFIRILFISVYECWFRGYLLTDSIANFGVIWAVLINICLYALLHVVNGKEEVIASFPYGLILCCLCIWQGAVWPAVVIHLALTVPYEVRFLIQCRVKLSLQNEYTNHRSFRIYR